MNILNVIKENPEISGKISFTITGDELLNFAKGFEKAQSENRIEIQSPPEKLLTPDEVAEQLGVSRVTLWSYDRRNILKPSKIGNTVRYRQSDIDAVVAQAKGQKVG